MKYFLSLFIVASSLLNAVCQNSTTDSLIKLLNNASNDTNQVNRLIAIASSYYFYKPDTSIAYSKKALQLARDLDFKRGIFQSLSLAGESSRILGDYPGSMKMQLEALEVSRKTKNGNGEIASLCYIGVIYNELKEYRSALNFLFPANAISQNLPIGPLTVFILTSMGVSYHFLNMPDSALYFLRQASIKNHEVNHPQLNSLIPISIGNIFAGIGNNDSALYYYTKGLQNSLNSNESINLGRGNLKIAELYFAEGKYDSSLYFVRNSFRESKRTAQKVNILEASTLLVKLYRQFHEMDSAFYYEDIATAMKDSLYGPEKFKKLQLLMLDKQEKQQEADSEEEQYRNNIKYTLLFISLGVFLIISFILFRANRQKQKAKTKIENAYVNLKDTQALLIQREKMASLGELTAGIAHEIQNPLNFVNNFSEVNTELIDELQEEVGKGNYEDVKAIANDIKENSQKINHHGKRAGDIVKGMLQHSRLSSGQKEPTDINALCDEYLRLSYHGLRAKDKDFNADFKTDFDKSIGNINIIPQDIGRVLLNILANAFYAVNEKSNLLVKLEGYTKTHGYKELELDSPSGDGGDAALKELWMQPPAPDLRSKGEKYSSQYQPTVSLSTKKINDKVEITITDNGNGIPPHILDKIFQPFFTTKPTGQGTGLGLSLAYDIIKAHGGTISVKTNYYPPGGEITVNSKVADPGSSGKGEGTEITIKLPIT